MIQYPAITNPTPTEVRTITSTYVQQEYQLFISLPASYAASDKTFPVLYLLDGNATYTMVRPLIELQQISDLIPELIMVGIGYPTATYMDTAALRGRDLTPVELTPEQKAGSYPFEETGGGPQFLNFLMYELIPFIDQNFRTDPNDRALLGLSLGALFVLYTLFEQPDLFKRLIAISPSIDLLDMDKRSLKENPFLPVKLYWGTEAPSDDLQILKEIEMTRQFVKDIRELNTEDLEVHLRIYEGEDHFSVGTIGFIHGLRKVYQ
jgi:predicted alpha/beta superfamily hydrolase